MSRGSGRAARLLIATAGLALVASDARAAALGGGGVKEILLELLNLVILVAAIVYFARKPIQAYFAERRRGIREDLDQAADLLSKAETRHSEWQRRLIDLDAELEQIRATARERAREDRERILADARAAAERIQRDASAAVEQELRSARAQLRREASQLAAELAERLLEENVNAGDQERLMDEFIAEVESAAGAAGVNGSGR